MSAAFVIFFGLAVVLLGTWAAASLSGYQVAVWYPVGGIICALAAIGALGASKGDRQ